MTVRLTILLLAIGHMLFAQKSEIKFGKVSKEELQLKECSFYPEANSMILGQTGVLNFVYNDQKGWQYRIIITKRIKVFNKLDKDIANISIVTYDEVGNSSREEINQLKGFTYNLVDGKVVKTKLTNSEEYTTRISDYRVERSFAMPDVQDGSVIEYRYTVLSDFTSNLYEWHFQSDLPTAYSEFQCVIPEFFFYNVSQVGSMTRLETTTSQSAETFTYRWESTRGGGVERGTGTLKSNSTRTTYVARNVLPVIDEPFMNNKPNIPGRLEYQLMTIKMPNSVVKQIAGNYEQFNKTIMDWSSFGKTLNKGNFAKDRIATLSDDPGTKAIEIYNWIQGHFAFTNTYGFTSEEAGRQAFNEGSGSVAGINLTLIAALREAGVEANPIILSTRGHGLPHPIYPNYQDFNYVIAAIKTSQGYVYADATTKLPFGVLPSRCLNGNGWMATENGGSWMPLKGNTSHITSTMTTISITEEEIVAEHSAKYSGYAAIEEKDDLEEIGQDKFGENFQAALPEQEVSDVEVEEESDNLKVFFTSSKYLDDAQTIYLQPLGMGTILSNPFKREERLSPIDIPYPIQKSVIVKIEIPEGYVAELPESAVISLPENGGKFIYSANQLGNTINLMSKFDLSKTDFSPTEYAYLKQYYELVAKKNNEMIVLKKI